MKEEIFPHPGKSPHWQGNQPGHRGSFGASEESIATSLQRAKQRKTCTDGWCCCLALPSLRRSLAGAGGGWVLRLGIRRSDPARGLGLVGWRQPEGARVRCGTTEGVREERGPTREARRHCGGSWEERSGTTIGASFSVPSLRQQGTAYMSSRGSHEALMPSQTPQVGAERRHHQGSCDQVATTAPASPGACMGRAPAHPLSRG